MPLRPCLGVFNECHRWIRYYTGARKGIRPTTSLMRRASNNGNSVEAIVLIDTTNNCNWCPSTRKGFEPAMQF